MRCFSEFCLATARSLWRRVYAASPRDILRRALLFQKGGPRAGTRWGASVGSPRAEKRERIHVDRAGPVRERALEDDAHEAA